MQSNVKFVYQLTICSATKENHGQKQSYALLLYDTDRTENESSKKSCRGNVFI
jgi:hypothetical protein